MAFPVGKMVQQLRRLVGADAASGLRDAELLSRFAATRDEAAFAALVARHGSLVFGVCRRVLNNAHDAEDALQATFLVLARRAAAIRKPASLASWLYGVAYRLAIKMKSEAGKRRRHEQSAASTARSVPGDLSWHELQDALDEELQRLPEKQRQPLLLCYLEGLSQEEAAAQLGWPRGTLKRRLERGRDVLRDRLTRRGLTLAAGLVAVLAAGDALAGCAPEGSRAALATAATLFVNRRTIAAGLVADRAVVLAEGVLKTMFTAKIKILSLLAVLLATTFGTAALCRQTLVSGSAVAEPLPTTQNQKLATAPAAAEDGDKKPSKAAEEFAALKENYEKAVVEFGKKAMNATEEERAQLAANSPNIRFLPQFNDLAEKHIKDRLSFDILVFALCRGNGPLFPEEQWDRSIELLTKHHAADERMKELLPTMTFWDEAAHRFLRTVLEKNPDKVAQARAAKILLRIRRDEVAGAQQYLDNPQIQRNLVQRTPNGAAYYRRLLDNRDNYRKEAEELDKLLKDKFAGLLPELVWRKPIPDGELIDLDGKKYKLNDLKGKIVVLNIFATDRPGMLDTMVVDQPKQARHYADKPVVVFNVCLDEQKQTFLDFLKKNQSPAINCWAGPRSEFAYEWTGEQHANPTNLIIDEQGVYQVGGAFRQIVVDQVDKLLAIRSASGRAGKATKATEAFIALRKQLDQAMAEDAEKRNNARNQPPEVWEEIEKNDPRRTFFMRFNELAEKHADDPAAFHFLRYAIMEFGIYLRNEAAIERSVALLAKHQADHPEMKDLLRSIQHRSVAVTREAAKPLARAVLEKNRDLEAQARACQMVVETCKFDLSLADYYLDHPQDREKLEKDRPDGREYYKALTERRDKIKKEIADHQQLLKDKYATVLEEAEK